MRYERLEPRFADPLAEFFAALRDAGDERWFHPHPLTATEAQRVCHYAGRDIYSALMQGDRVMAYGMLRGWDDGLDVPSLGVAVHPAERGRGLGRLLMERLHAEARKQGANCVRLTVEAGNDPARRLYDELGYVFEAREGGLEGVLGL